MNKLEVEQKVIVECLNMRLAGNGTKRYRWETVTKIGRKYFEVSGFYNEMRFRLDNLQSDYSTSYCVHLSSQALYDQIASQVAYDRIWQLFNGYKSNPAHYTSDQLLSACSALGLTEEVNEALKPKIEKLMEDLRDE